MNDNIIVDPLNNFNHLSKPYLKEALGLIPNFVYNEDCMNLDAKEALEQQYGFGSLYDSKDTTITEDGMYLYPGDEPLFPLAKMIRKDEFIWQYQYGLVIIQNAETKEIFATRMD